MKKKEKSHIFILEIKDCYRLNQRWGVKRYQIFLEIKNWNQHKRFHGNSNCDDDLPRKILFLFQISFNLVVIWWISNLTERFGNEGA